MIPAGGLVSNAGRMLRQLRHSPVSWGLCGLTIGIQLAVDLAGGMDALARWYETLGLSRSGFLSGKVWQLLTYGLLHGAWWHAGLNAVFVLLIGSRIEFITGRAVLLGVTLAGILGGGIAHLLVGSGLLVGLSGGCISLLLCLTTLSPESRMFPLPVSGRNLGLGILMAELGLALIDPGLGLPGFSAVGELAAAHGMASWFEMGHACHFGGGLAGWVYGRWILRPRVTLERLRRDRARREAG
jgi:membrane associated rhomboid family serine protease